MCRAHMITCYSRLRRSVICPRSRLTLLCPFCRVKVLLFHEFCGPATATPGPPKERQLFTSLRRILEEKLGTQQSVLGHNESEQKKQKNSEIKHGFDEAYDLKLREYKSDLNNLKGEVKRITSVNTSAARDELLESGIGDTLKVSADQRSRLLTSTDRLNQSSERIKESRTMLETEELGVSILQDLHQQRQSLLHAHSTQSFYILLPGSCGSRSSA